MTTTILLIFLSGSVYCVEKLFDAGPCKAGYTNGLDPIESDLLEMVSENETHLEVFIELVQDQTHAIHKAIHVRRFTFVVGGSLVCSKGLLERFEVLHPLDRKFMRLYIGLIEYQDER